MLSELKRIVENFEELISGPFDNFWFFLDKKSLLFIKQIILKIIYYYTLIQILSFLINLIDLIFTDKYVWFPINTILHIYITILKIVPLLGQSLDKKNQALKHYILNVTKPFLENYKKTTISKYWLFLIEKSIKNPASHIKLVITGDLYDKDDNSNPQTSMVFSNHRSIFDYVVLQSIFRDINNDNSINFSCWGKILDIPNIRLFKEIFTKNENFRVDVENICNKKNNQNNTILFFPEVNVMTYNVKILQDKLNLQNDNPVCKETLYPRYNTFLSLCHFYQQTNKESQKQMNLKHENTQSKQKFFYNSTLTYYKPELVSKNEDLHHYLAHQNDFCQQNISLLQNYKNLVNFKWNSKKTSNDQNSKHKDCKYQILQVSPSFLECFLPINRNEKQPLIIRVHIEKLPLNLLLDKSDKQLELFLEKKFAAKDDIINQFESNLKIKKHKK